MSALLYRALERAHDEFELLLGAAWDEASPASACELATIAPREPRSDRGGPPSARFALAARLAATAKLNRRKAAPEPVTASRAAPRPARKPASGWVIARSAARAVHRVASAEIVSFPRREEVPPALDLAA